MAQIWNIFRKDCRHYWREASASIALLAAFGWNVVRGWHHGDDLVAGTGGLFSYNFLSGSLDVLVPVSWALLVVRVIQGESLVGDRQFWLTRPYEWEKLLAAKVIFSIVFVNCPLLILDVFLLSKAGFTPTHYFIGLLWMQLMIVLFFLLPAIALATVTAGIVQTLLALLLIALYMVGMAALAAQIPSSDFSGPSDSLLTSLFIGVCLAVILTQYARRNTFKSRMLIVGLAAAILILLVATPYRVLVAREWPQLSAGQQPPFQLGILPVETGTADEPSVEEKEVEIHVPLSVTGLSSESIVIVNGIFVTIDAPDGLRWDSGWKSPGIFLFPEQKDTRVNFTLKRKFFKRVQSSQVKLRLSVAFTLFQDENRRPFVVPRGEFAVPNVGLCSVLPVYVPRIECLAPLRQPSFLLMTTDMSKNTCPLGEGESPWSPGEIARGWTQNGGSEPAEFGISPVTSFGLYLSNWSGSSNRRLGDGVCPGTTVVFSNPEPVLSNQVTMQIEGVHLADYREKPLRYTFGNIQIKSR
jgi:hypothetical protein